MSDTKKLSPRSVQLAKLPKRGTKQRNGFADESGQVFIPPVNSKRLTHWQKTMEQKGYTF